MRLQVLSILAFPWLLAGSEVFASDGKGDESITKQVNALFAQHADLGTELSVRTENGVVFLNGFASTPLEKQNAEDLAKSIVGVHEVIDNIGVSD